MKIKLLFAAFMCFFLEFTTAQTWLGTYNGPGNGDDEITAICSDDSGNVYVTGYSLGLSTGYDITTIKYAANGQQLWAARYDEANGEDKAYGIVIDDDAGDLYVCGYVSNGVNNADLVLIKYNAAGTKIWSRAYNNNNGSSDKAMGIVVESPGNYIYLTGSTTTGNNSDYLTVKYNSSGSFKWAKTYDNGGEDNALGIVIDAADHIIVTGSSEGSTSSCDYLTIKYVSDGNVSWTKRYNGSANGEDKAMGIVVDAAENYTITGNSMGGAEVGTNDIVTIQYSKNGTVNWTKIYNGEDNLSDNAFGIKVDNSDNIIITGSTTLFSTSQDFITIKYSQSGIQQWTSVNNISENNSDIAYGITVSNDGSVIYVAGSSTTQSGIERIAIAKYSSNGVLEQSILYPSNGNTSCVSLNNENDLFLGGYHLTNSSDGIPNKDFITMDFQRGSLIIIGISGNNN